VSKIVLSDILITEKASKNITKMLRIITLDGIIVFIEAYLVI